jgi:hypothetical protein
VLHACGDGREFSARQLRPGLHPPWTNGDGAVRRWLLATHSDHHLHIVTAQPHGKPGKMRGKANHLPTQRQILTALQRAHGGCSVQVYRG